MMKKVPYIHDVNTHNKRSASVVVPIIMKLVQPESVIDIGCGLGSWLAIFENHGVRNILGIDGDWVDKSKLNIDIVKFKEHDLTSPLKINQKYDLAICLEVAEHLPERAAGILVESLVRSGKSILFSAAIPNQGGQNHLNEQWHYYWVSKFEKYGFYAHDVIRPLIWENEQVEWWYRQNCFLFTTQQNESSNFINALHPKLLEDKIQHIQNIRDGKMGVKQSYKIFMNAIKNFIKRWIQH